MATYRDSPKTKVEQAADDAMALIAARLGDDAKIIVVVHTELGDADCCIAGLGLENRKDMVARLLLSAKQVAESEGVQILIVPTPGGQG